MAGAIPHSSSLRGPLCRSQSECFQVIGCVRRLLACQHARELPAGICDGNTGGEHPGRDSRNNDSDVAKFGLTHDVAARVQLKQSPGLDESRLVGLVMRWPGRRYLLGNIRDELAGACCVNHS